MSRKNNENDISPEELLRRLRENMEMEDMPEDFNFELPEEPAAPDASAPDPEETVRLRALAKADELARPQVEDDRPAAEEYEIVPEIYSEAGNADDGGTAADDYVIPENFEIELPEEPDIEAILDENDQAAEDAEYGQAEDAEEYLPAEEVEEYAPAEDTAEFAPAEDTAEFAPAEDTAEFAPAEDTAEFAPAEDTAEDTAEFETDDDFDPDAVPMEEAFSRAMGVQDESGRPSTREIPNIAGEDGEPLPPDEPITGEAVDELMRKYLSEDEYNAIEHSEDDLELHMENAEDYVASIENAKQADEPRAPVTETEKAVQQLSGIETDSDLDEVDVNLMIAFGMEKELSEHIGEENVQAVREAMDIDAEMLDFSRGEKLTTELPDDMEFISQSQIKDVFSVYKRKQRRLILRFFGAVIIAVAIFIFENFTLFGGSFEGTWLDPAIFPTVRSMASLQLCFFALALVPSALFAGMKSLFTFKPTARSVLSLMAIGTVIYHIAVCFLYDGTQIIFCTFPLAVCVILTVISEYMALRRDVYSFRIVSSKRQKYVISEIQNDTPSLERDAFADYIDEDYTVSRVAKTSFIDGFFRRTKASTRGVPALRAILPLPIVIAIFFFIFSAFVRRDLYLGLTNAYIAFMLAAPASVLLLFAAPLGRASRIAYEQGGAIIGEDALDEYSDVAAISFEDKDVFPSGGVRIRSIKVFNNNRIDRVIYNVASLFKYLGGPLADVYSIATKDFECSDDVEIVDIADDGIEAVVSGKRIFLGREDFIVRCGFDPVYEPDDAAFFGNPGCSITYLVSNDEVSAKIYTQYSIDPGFISIAKQLYNAGMFLGIKTFDPGIDSDLLAGFVDLEKYPIKVIKCHSTADRTPTEEKTDSGIVSKKSTRSLLKALALCENVNSTTKAGTFITMASVLIAFGISAFLTFNDVIKGSSTGIYVALYQLFWIIPVAIISRLNIKR
ncbi:MAG: hypothetical protein IJR90_02505 [Clostridia bacterium]|nr:hypothetical protein [Clostridia bacterium]